MRIAISKLVRERSDNLNGLLPDSDMNMTSTGEAFRAEFRTLDIKPFDFTGYGSIDIDHAEFDRLKPGIIYELTMKEIKA